jgi:predicted nucleic acid-binding protein
VIYLDSAAVVKLARAEQGTAQLVSWLNGRPDTALVSSVLIEVEVPRALRRHEPGSLAALPSALARVVRFEMDTTVRATAAAIQDRTLRSLDAIHVATAMLLAGEADSGLDAFVTYDKRLLAAAADNGLPVASPGADQGVS